MPDPIITSLVFAGGKAAAIEAAKRMCKNGLRTRKLKHIEALACGDEEAAARLTQMMEDPRERQWVSTYIHEQLLGSQRISLAAALIGMAEVGWSDDYFWDLASFSVHGMRDAEALAFLVLMGRCTVGGYKHHAQKNAMQVQILPDDFDRLDKELQRDLNSVGAYREILPTVWDSLISRGIMLPDETNGMIGQLSGVIYPNTIKFYDLLYRAAEMASDEIGLTFDLEQVDSAKAFERYRVLFNKESE